MSVKAGGALAMESRGHKLKRWLMGYAIRRLQGWRGGPARTEWKDGVDRGQHSVATRWRWRFKATRSRDGDGARLGRPFRMRGASVKSRHTAGGKMPHN
ncbi:unnamed protein product [Calypogeia fissa]